MPGKRGGQQKQVGLVKRCRLQVVAITAVLSLVAGWTMLAYSGAFDSAFRQKTKKGSNLKFYSEAQ